MIIYTTEEKLKENGWEQTDIGKIYQTWEKCLEGSDNRIRVNYFTIDHVIYCFQIFWVDETKDLLSINHEIMKLKLTKGVENS